MRSVWEKCLNWCSIRKLKRSLNSSVLFIYLFISDSKVETVKDAPKVMPFFYPMKLQQILRSTKALFYRASFQLKKTFFIIDHHSLCIFSSAEQKAACRDCSESNASNLFSNETTTDLESTIIPRKKSDKRNTHQKLMILDNIFIKEILILLYQV